jgi:heat shock protein HslJ/uncharacterized lipoprotein YbaY
MRHFALAVTVAATSWLCVFSAGSLAAEGVMQTIEGTVTYRERIALPPDAYVIVEAHGPEGAVIAGTRVPSEGRQVPLPYTLELPVDVETALYATIYVGGQPRWASDPIALTADRQPEGQIEIIVKPLGQTFRAGGNEPGWNLEIDGDRIVLVTDYGANRREGALPEPEHEEGATIYRVEDLGAKVQIADTLCRDDATGMPHPKTVTVETADGNLSGCGGEPIELLTGPEWTVEDIMGGGIVDSSKVTIRFEGGQRIEGSGGCNSYSGPFDLTGEGLTFGNLMSTMMACEPSLMDQERRFFDALQSVALFDVDETGALLLKTQDGTVAVRATRQ